MLMDATSAMFADLDVMRLVGLVDGDWPERSSKSIFFPSKLLEPLGWPSGSDRLAAARARFHDLLRLPALSVGVSTFSLEDDCDRGAVGVCRRDRRDRLRGARGTARR